MKTAARLLIMMTSAALLMGCLEGKTAKETLVLDKNSFDANLYKLNTLVCDPVNNVPPTNMGKGLKAELYYTQGVDLNNVQAYFDQGTKSDAELFFSRLYVPTQMFDLGFPTETGDYLKDDNDNKLIEYFGLKFRSVLKLREDQEPGFYEIALLSDDGTVMRYRDQDGAWQTVVNNDGDHPTRMGCGTDYIYMDETSEVEIEIDYYQGPRYHISLVPLWRKVDPNNPQDEPLCGQQGNHKYFNPNKNSEEQQSYFDLLARNWEPIAADNYHLPVDAQFNPCVIGESAKITNYTVELFEGNDVLVTWNTDLPTSSQVMITNTSTGEVTITDSDNILRTYHTSILTFLNPGETYEIRAIAISDTFGKTISGPQTITVP